LTASRGIPLTVVEEEVKEQSFRASEKEDEKQEVGLSRKLRDEVRKGTFVCVREILRQHGEPETEYTMQRPRLVYR
jgi:hypothetical protein